MTAVQAIKSIELIRDVENILIKNNFRDYILFKLGINLGLRISDLLNLNISDVKNKNKISLIELKTKKKRIIPINKELKKILNIYIKNKADDEPLFAGRNLYNRLSRISAYRIISNACKKVNIEGNFGTHTLRKTFGYHFYKKFKDIAMLQKIFNHSHPSTTLRYIGIDEEEIYNSYMKFSL
ncbi:MAG: site-specific integrase [Candidatus Gastranaerophilaceae bacterium]